MADPVVKTIAVEFKGSLPGEGIVVAAFNYAATVRETMDPSMRLEWDKRMLRIYDDWRKFWASIGVVEPLPPGA